MYLIGSNNSKFVNEEYIKGYLEQNHRTDSVYGLSKGNYFWMMDMTFKSQEDAAKYIKLYEGRGFTVYHNITIVEEAEEKTISIESEEANVELEQHILLYADDTEKEFVPEVKPVEEKKPKKRKRTGGSKRKE